jgi:hypothetical protein
MRDESVGFKACAVLVECCATRRGRVRPETDHKAQVTPLIQEVSIDVDAVGLTQVLGDQGPYGREIFFFQRMFVLYVAQFAGEVFGRSWVHHAESLGADGL